MRVVSGNGVKRQQGVVLFFALIALIAITLAAMSLMRSRDNAVVIAGNLAFRQAVVAATDVVVEDARNWLMANAGDAIGTGLNTSKIANGYYAFSTFGLDVTGQATATKNDDVDWDGNLGVGLRAYKVPQAEPALSVGQQFAYVIRRLCRVDNVGVSGAGQECAVYTTKGESDSKQDQDAGSRAVSGGRFGYYQVTVRVTGPKNTVSYVQTVIMI
ncbi:hypothetical protein [Chitinivorax sp. B]|uniref:pilus assembly PilX family protein n=1 Tax=Chitinivorax sp. B TaxID=2502235 RepID=UPI0010FA357F|nr:hypothetical protein [Chitinivorax sp. B]